jgi:hypothetical protein
LLVLGLATVVHAQDAAATPVQGEPFKARDTPIAIPAPLPEMSEMEGFVAPSNRRIAGFEERFGDATNS